MYEKGARGWDIIEPIIAIDERDHIKKELYT
jgi:hypothetical protein